MALVDCESFDWSATLAQAGWIVDGNVSLAANGRWGTNCVQCNDWDERVHRDYATGYGTLYLGFACLVTQLPPNTQPIVAFWEILGSGSAHVRLCLTAAGSLVFQRGDGTVIGSYTSAGVITENVWAYIEIKVVVSDTVGEAVLVVDGTQLLSGTGLDTRMTGTGVVDRLAFGGFNNAVGVLRVDDYWLNTDSFYGDCRVQNVKPSGNGNSSQFVGSDGNSTDNYLLVDDPSTATGDYVESATVGNKDTYAMGDLTPTTGTIKGVKLIAYAQKTDAGIRNLALVARTAGGTEADSADKALSASWATYTDLRETKPGGGAWSVSDVNGAEFGVKVSG